MKVRDLIKRLERYNQETHVAVIDDRWLDQTRTDLVLKRVRIDVVTDSLLHKGEPSDSAESVLLITFKGAQA